MADEELKMINNIHGSSGSLLAVDVGNLMLRELGVAVGYGMDFFRHDEDSTVSHCKKASCNQPSSLAADRHIV